MLRAAYIAAESKQEDISDIVLPATIMTQEYSALPGFRIIRPETISIIFTICSNICAAALRDTFRMAVKKPPKADDTAMKGRLAESMRIERRVLGS